MEQSSQEYMNKINELTGKTKEEITELYKQSGLSKHSEIRKLFMDQLGLSYGYANTLVHLITKTDSESLSKGKDLNDILNDMYSGKKEVFRPVHDLVMKKVHEFGEFEVAPKKGYLSLKRKRQFATIGPKTNSRMEIGINLKDYEGTSRLLKQPKGSMCKFIVKITDINEVDDELMSWLLEAYKQSNG